MTTGIIACAFGQQATYSAGPSNAAIADTALRIKRKTGGLLSTQWEVESFLEIMDASADHLVSHFNSGSHYVTTQQVFEESFSFFKEQEVERLIVVAHPLHLKVIRLVMRRWDIPNQFTFDWQFTPMMQWIPYDKSNGNVQPWTRGPLPFAAYLIKAQLFGSHGK